MDFEIRHYRLAGGRDIFGDWLGRQRNMMAKAAILRRVNRVRGGNFGDHAFCREGVWELRIDVGGGYRLYYAIADRRVVVLLCGGDKATQDSDISRACGYWRDWQRRTDDAR